MRPLSFEVEIDIEINLNFDIISKTVLEISKQFYVVQLRFK